MKRYVKEIANDFRKYYEKKCKEHPSILPAGFLREVRMAEHRCEHGLVTDREAAEKILKLWSMCDEWIWQHEGEAAIKL